MKNALKISLLIVLASATLYYSCDNNDDSTGKSILRIHLTDLPANYEAVYVDIQEIRINATNEENSGWVTLENINAGVYDLLKLTNGIDTLLGENEIPSGKISQIRLVLGERNSVVVDGDSVELSTPSAQQSGLKLQVHTTLEPELAYDVLLDFDAAQSVVKAGNSGKYNLKPVIRVFVEQSTGSIKGIISPDSVKCVVYAIVNGDSASTYTNDEGQFLIKGLEPSTYSVYIEPGSNSIYGDSTLTNLNVSVGNVLDLGTVNLKEK